MKFAWTVALLVVVSAVSRSAMAAFDWPVLALAGSDQESVYAVPASPDATAGINNGGVNIAIDVMYTTDYVFRGIDRSEFGGSEDAPNVQFDSTLSFDLGKLPHPFIGVFVNIYNSDPISRFQEIRPYLGIDWTIRPINLVLGHNTYLYPERDETNTSEVFGKLTIDDSGFWQTSAPILSPYLLAAYDYDLYNGWYIEAGVAHDFQIEDTGLVITPTARVAYVMAHQFFAAGPDRNDSGFQHYDVGFNVRYSLNKLFEVSPRFGEWSLQGECFYTDNINNELRADTQIWGGIGIGFKY